MKMPKRGYRSQGPIIRFYRLKRMRSRTFSLPKELILKIAEEIKNPPVKIPQSGYKKYQKPFKLPEIPLCRVCQKEVPRDGFSRRPEVYCSPEHRKLWRNEYRRIWQKNYDTRIRKNRLLRKGYQFKKVEEGGQELKLAA